MVRKMHFPCWIAPEMILVTVNALTMKPRYVLTVTCVTLYFDMTRMREKRKRGGVGEGGQWEQNITALARMIQWGRIM